MVEKPIAITEVNAASNPLRSVYWRRLRPYFKMFLDTGPHLDVTRANPESIFSNKKFQQTKNVLFQMFYFFRLVDIPLDMPENGRIYEQYYSLGRQQLGKYEGTIQRKYNKLFLFG